MGDKPYCHISLKDPFEENESVKVMHVVLFHDHADQLIAEDKREYDTRHRHDHVVRQRADDRKHRGIPVLRRFPYLRCHAPYRIIHLVEKPRQVSLDTPDQKIPYPLPNLFEDTIHTFPPPLF